MVVQAGAEQWRPRISCREAGLAALASHRQPGPHKADWCADTALCHGGAGRPRSAPPSVAAPRPAPGWSLQVAPSRPPRSSRLRPRAEPAGWSAPPAGTPSPPSSPPAATSSTPSPPVSGEPDNSWDNQFTLLPIKQNPTNPTTKTNNKCDCNEMQCPTQVRCRVSFRAKSELPAGSLSRGPSPLPAHRLAVPSAARPRPQSAQPRPSLDPWLTDEGNDLIRSCGALGRALGLHRSFSCADMMVSAGETIPPPLRPARWECNTCNSIDWEVWYWPRGCHVGLYSGSEPTHPIPKTHPVNHTQRPLERKALLLYNRLGLRMDGYICSRFIPSHLKIGK